MTIRITKARADLLAFIRDNPCTINEARQEMGISHHRINAWSVWLYANGLIREVCRIRLGSRGPYASMYEITNLGRAALKLSDCWLIDSKRSCVEATQSDLDRLARRETTPLRLS